MTGNRVVRQNGQVKRLDTIDLGFPLGLEEEIAGFIDEAAFSLQPGEGIVLYTDGITEAENQDGRQYGIERLCAVISAHWRASADTIKRAVIDDVISFIGEHNVYDGLTLIILKQQ